MPHVKEPFPPVMLVYQKHCQWEKEVMKFVIRMEIVDQFSV